MSLYYDAATVLTSDALQGSLKSRVYNGNAGIKAKPAHVYALISECAKYDTFLKEVIDNAAILAHEPKLSPLLCLLLVHDHLFAKGGIAASASHALKLAVERHKARLQAEFTKARLRRKCGNVEDLKKALLAEKGALSTSARPQPRWVRINTLRSSLRALQDAVFAGFTNARSLREVANAKPLDRVLYQDPQVPDLIALPPDANLTKTDPYLQGQIILQDKASCFPAQLLLGGANVKVGDVIDGCAAPGNKTTHLAAMLGTQMPPNKSPSHCIYACERDPARSTTLQRMVDKAGASQVHVMGRQDFLALQPQNTEFANVTHLLLDPSCSGSGILRREDVPKLKLPADLRAQGPTDNKATSKKRKRVEPHVETGPSAEDEEEQPTAASATSPERLAKLSDWQCRIVEHAMAFPAAQRITYSTCSIHCEENETVVARLLVSAVAKEHGWRVLPRERQSEGLKAWPHRGVQPDQTEPGTEVAPLLSEADLDGCIRCYPNDAEGTMGFFVVCFERDIEAKSANGGADGFDEDEWGGFSDGSA